MFHRVTSWPKIIATLVGGIGLSLIFAAANYTSTRQGIWITWDWRVIVASVLLLVMSYLLATGREWARRILLIAGVLIGAGLGLYYVVGAASYIYFTDLTPEQAEVIRLSTRLERLSEALLIFTLLVFVVLWLSHPDVVASFRSRSQPPNKV